MRKEVILGITIPGILAIAVLGAWYFTNPVTPGPSTREAISIGEYPYEASALIYIAEDRGLFSENGLNVTTREYSSGPAVIEGLSKGEVDLGLSSEYAVASGILAGDDLDAIGVVDKYQTTHLVARKDRGIENAGSLAGKKLGITRGGSGEFYLGRFLTLREVNPQSLTLVDMPPSQYVEALSNGSVDALVTGVYINEIRERWGDAAVIWPIQSSQDSFWVVSCMKDRATSHGGQIQRFLKSIDEAGEFLLDHPEEARAAVKERLGLDSASMDLVLQQNEYSLTLGQDLVIAMEDESRWMMANNLTDATAVQDFRKHIYTDGLDAVRPGSVNIIG